MEVPINIWAVLLATASSMVVGTVWYAKPVFGRSWMKMVGLKEEATAKGAGLAIGITVVVSFLTAYVLAHVTYLSYSYFQLSFLQSALNTAFWVWLGFTAARFITHDAFERRPIKLTAMNIAHELVTILVMGGIIGLMGIQ